MFTAPRAILLSASLGLGLLLMLPAAAAQAQAIDFTGLKQDTSLPVQVESDTLTVDQASGTATFTGAVKVVQGDMTISAASARVEYAEGGQGIEKLFFTGRVTVSTPTEAAEADEAVYTIATGEVVMTGDVLLT
ncbi:MAG: lipopolysaccharide transport periplasmic protein LptA, partial [Pseudomonadota bacterium]